MQDKRLKLIIIVSAVYIALTLFSNLGSLRILALGVLSLDGGTLLYPFTFTCRDLLHKKAGGEISRFVIILSAILNLLMFIFIMIVAVLPADQSVGPQLTYGQVLLPGIRLVIGSIVAMTISELIDTEIYSLVRKHYGNSHQWLRVFYSNLVSIPIDTIIFLVIAFGGILPATVLLKLFVANLLIKFIVSIVSMGSIYLVKDDQA